MVDKITLKELRQRLEANPALVLVEALPEQALPALAHSRRDQPQPRRGRCAGAGAGD
jgi:hypothetical protein